MNNYWVVFLLLIAGSTHSCKKGTLEKATVVTDINIRLKTTDANSRYQVFLDGQVIGDTLNSEAQLSKLVEIKQEPQRLEVREINGDVFFDTTMILPTPQVSFFLYQLNAGEKPFVLPGTDDEPSPGADSVKWRFIYTNQSLPDVIKLRYYYVDAFTLTAEAFDSVVLQRGQISRYTSASLKKYSPNLEDAYWGIDIENSSTGELIQKVDLDPNSPRFMEGLLFEVRTTFGLPNKKQTHLLDFGSSIYGGVTETFYGRFLIGSD